VLIEEGFSYDASIFPIRHDRYGIADAPRHAHMIQRGSGAILELPSSTVRVGQTNYPIAGGGYFRLFPYAMTKWGITQVNTADQQPVMLYIHPWEVDPEQPRLPASMAAQLRHHVGMNTTIDKLNRVIDDFAFAPVRDVFSKRTAGVVAATPRFAPAPLR
jgi:polysaccharide deacetylase family protein (PEP-CTERM system associated)